MMHIFVTALSLLAFSVDAHEWKRGTCPQVQPIPNLSLSKFLGGWYVIEQFDTSSKCLKFTYKKDSETTVKITKSREFPWVNSLGVDHTSDYTGNLDIPFADNQGFMRVKWPLNLAGKGDYYVIDTDYENYAGVYDCQNIITWFHRENAAILSRTPTLDDIYIDRVKRKLESFSLDTSHFNSIDHTNCRNSSDANVNLDFDENTFRNVFNSAADSVKDAAKEAAKGIEGVAETVSKTISGGEEEELSQVKTKGPKK